MAGVTRKTLLDQYQPAQEHPLEPVLMELATWAREAYCGLLNTDGFVSFFRQATPIDAIEQSRIGSRPSRRTGQQSLADLRAILGSLVGGKLAFSFPAGMELDRLSRS